MSSTVEIIVVLGVVGIGAYLLYERYSQVRPAPASQVSSGLSQIASGLLAEIGQAFGGSLSVGGSYQ